MGRFLPKRPSPAFVVAVIALVAALGGTSYAAISLPKNSVGSRQLKKNAVTTSKIKKHAVTSAKINPAGLTVPNATNATNATAATKATTADHLATLPSGSTESGSFAASGPDYSYSEYLGVGITFSQPLAAALNSSANVVATTSTTTNCPGVGQAAPGYLCLYMFQSVAAYEAPSYVYVNARGGGQYGVILYWITSGSGSNFVSGTWSVTAP